MTRDRRRAAPHPAEPGADRLHRGDRPAPAHGQDPGRRCRSWSRGSRRRAAGSAAEAIMTTDTRPEGGGAPGRGGGRPVTIGGIAKGVGMIEPHMATMFCFLATDAMVARDALPRVLRRAVDGSFNRITRGRRPVARATRWRSSPTGWPRTRRSSGAARACASSRAALEAIAERLAHMLVEDGEGRDQAGRGARCAGRATRREAVLAARSVANSPLVKTAINGADPNWGRIMMALGKSPGAGGRRTGSPSRSATSSLVEKGMLRPGAPARPDPRGDGRARATPSPSTSASGAGEDRCGHRTSARSTFGSTAKYTT